MSLSLKYVGRLRGVSSGGAVSVARLRDEVVIEEEMMERDTCRSDGAFRHLNLVAVDAIVTVMEDQCSELKLLRIPRIIIDC